MLRIIHHVFIVYIFFLSTMFGIEYGSISGMVVDVLTGKPLIGADVIVVGTELGATANSDGQYAIDNIPVGEYGLAASYISYEPITYKNILVNPNTTAVVNFR